ncbi:hypothetical protein QFC21_004161 [Naganishia friedmannii]|uniref:Uncharacterized protein n=1 Tax=Naganishia friedmannii TaxID=89922 RepID=A0ACC2VIQ4_9TREE|nr:hypothetical protein QFC21_004161 [Naganishia friedmannii]
MNPATSSRSISQSVRHSSSTTSPNIKREPSPSPPLRSVSPEPSPHATPLKTAVPPTDLRDIDYRQHPELYRILRGEMNVFKTQPYSNDLKGLWRYKDEPTAKKSAADLWKRFEEYRMDITRKFIQMGRTRSLRYALRPGGRKYDKTTGQEMKRTGKVSDEGKLKGAQAFEGFLKRLEADEVYVAAKARWRKEVEGRKK